MASTKKFSLIKIGAEGKEVKDCQKALRAAGSKIQLTGKFGIGMYSAVKSFQKKNGLPATGEIDAKTFLKLSAYMKAPAKKTAGKK